MKFLNKKSFLRKTFFAALFCVSAVSYANAQDTRVVFPETNISVKDGFEEIERQTDYLISVNHNNLDVSRRVRLTRNNLSVKDAMNQLLSRSGNTFVMHGQHIVVAPAKNKAGEQNETQELPRQVAADLPKPPVDVDSLEMVLRARKLEFPAEIPPVPALDKTAYYEVRDRNIETPSVPSYINSMPKVAVRTNLLYAVGALAPNLGVELGLAKRSTILMTGSYNGWKLNDDSADKKLCHWLLSAEYRYWLCERFNGHFFGAHAFFGNYHIAGHKIPMILESGSEDFRYKGNVAGAGLSYGYQLQLGRRWNMEFNAGLGFGVMNYDKFDCDKCSDEIGKDMSRTFVAPTKLGISIVYIIK